MNSPINDINANTNDQEFENRFQLSLKLPLEKITYLLCIITGVTIIVSWFIGYKKALSIFEGSATMKFNTALVFLLIGLNLFLLHKTEVFRKTIYNLISASLIIIAILSLLSNYDIVFLNIDDIFKVDIFSEKKPGLMSPATATCALLMAIGFIFIKSDRVSFENFATKPLWTRSP